jgi:hypothetical protein
MALNRQTGIIAGGAAMLAVAGVTMFMLLSGGLQSQIDSAPCGSVIELEAGTTIPANIKLPNKNCTDYITIQSSRAKELPEGQRINPATQAELLVTLESTINAEPVIQTMPGAHHYKFIGVRIKTQSESVFVYDLVRFDNGSHHIVLDRSWVEGNSNQDTQRGVTLNCADCSVMNSQITNIRGKGMDTQAVCGWNGTLRAQIINSYLEATGENIMFGGADSASEAMIPRNVEIRRNTIAKLMEWKGKGYTIKNLIELKSCIDCTIDANVLENNWGNEGQAGAAIVITVRNQDCRAPWSTIQNGSFTNNIVTNSVGVFNFLGKDNEAEPTYIENGKPKCGDPGESFGSVRGNAFLVANNVFDKITGSFITINGFYSVTVENNTDLQTCVEGCNTATFYGEPSQNYIHRNNVHDEKAYGLAGDAGKPMSFYAPNSIITGNVIAKPYAPWPAGNETVAALTITSDYRTPYTGKGADIDKLLAAQAGVGPQPTPTPSPSATATVTVSPSPSATATPTATSTPTATATATPTSVSPDGTKLPPVTQIVDSDMGIWTLSGQTMLRNGVDTGGRGSLILWLGGKIYAIGINGAWWVYLGGTSWASVGGDPSLPVSTPTPSVVPTATPTPTATPLPSPSATATPVPCSLTVPASISITRFGTRAVTVSMNRAGAITATALSGQVTVSPNTRTVTSTSPQANFQLTVKNNTSSVRFDSPCGSKTMQVMVVR